jgi:hypothetical protein
MESTISNTLAPSARKDSAIAVAAYAARILANGGLSDVDTTTTAR